MAYEFNRSNQQNITAAFIPPLEYCTPILVDDQTLDGAPILVATVFLPPAFK